MDDLKPQDMIPASVCGRQAMDSEACAQARRRGRPRAYDPDQVLETVLEVFWMKGFAATSLDDLSEATGVSRPSLAAGFGDKEALYIKAMERYRAQLNEQLDQVLTCQGGTGGLPGIILRYFDVMIGAYTGEAEHPLGCAFMCTALNEAPQHESILCLLQSTISEFDRRFEAFFAEAQARGHLGPHQNPKVLAQLILGLTSSIGIRARAGASREELREIVTQTTTQLFT